MTPIEKVGHALRQSQVGDSVKMSGDGFRSRCASCLGTRTDKLRVSKGADGTVLLKCFGGCSAKDIVSAIGLEMTDLFLETRNGNGHLSPVKTNSQDFLSEEQALAVHVRHLGDPTHHWKYHNDQKEHIGTVYRFGTNGQRTYRPVSRTGQLWRPRAPETRPLYNLPQVLDADVVWVFEGEKCAGAAKSIGLAATTSWGGSGQAKQTEWRPLKGKRIYIVPDSGDAGKKYLDAVLKQLPDDCSVSVCNLGFREPNLDIVDWLKQRDAVEPETLVNELVSMAKVVRGSTLPDRYQAADLVLTYPRETEPIIDGLLRRGETANIIAATKVGKSWMALDLALSIASGKPWLGMPTTQGKVLVIDNELRPETLSSRLSSVSKARAMRLEGLPVDLWPLRGTNTDLFKIDDELLGKLKPASIDFIVLDAMYRFLPANSSENDAVTMTRIYNLLDSHAKRLNCSFAVVHHASKGDQSGKAISDIGSGSGAQSRAVDAHIAIRPHEQGDGDVAVLDAAVRSFPPPKPLTIKYTHPVWEAKPLVPAVVKTPKKQQEINRKRSDDEAKGSVIEAMREVSEPMSILGISKKALMGKEKCARMVGLLKKEKRVVRVKTPDGKRKDTDYYEVTEEKCSNTS